MKKIIVLTVSFFLILTVYLCFNKKNDNAFISPIQNEKMAYYVDNGNDGYDKQNTIPIGNYVINEEKSKCLAGGTISDYNSTQGTIKYTLFGSDKCSVYFDEAPIILNQTVLSNLSPLNELGGMYRYTSESETEAVNNYVCLAGNITICNNPAQNDNYLYRIIGITKNDPVGNPDGLVKIIKGTPVESVPYNNDTSQANASATKWGNNDLYKRLNGIASNGEPIFKNAEGYEFLSNLEAKAIIVPANWKIKDVDSFNSTDFHLPSFNALAQYNAENPSNNASDKLISDENNKHYYGLAYISDFLYSNKTNNTDFPNSNARTYSNNKKGWMYNHAVEEGESEWPITRYGWMSFSLIKYVAGWFINSDGSIDAMGVSTSRDARPVLYLSNNTKILNTGNGSKNAPYIIKVD